MRASRFIALSAFSLCLGSTAASADETAKPAPREKVIVLDPLPPIRGRAPHLLSVDLARLIPRVPLPQLRQPLVDRIGAAVEKDPF
jgi:hypothetical protein